MDENMSVADMITDIGTKTPGVRTCLLLFRDTDEADRGESRLQLLGMSAVARLNGDRGAGILTMYPGDPLLQNRNGELVMGSFLVEQTRAMTVHIHTATADGPKHPHIIGQHPPVGESRVFKAQIEHISDWWKVATIFLQKGLGAYVCGGDQMVFVPRPRTRAKGQTAWQKLRKSEIKGLKYMGLCSTVFAMGQSVALTIDSDL